MGSTFEVGFLMQGLNIVSMFFPFFFLRKQKEAKKERKRKIKLLMKKEAQEPLVGEDEGFSDMMKDDPYFAEAFDPEEFPDAPLSEGGKKKKNKKKKKQQEEETVEDAKKKAQLELLMLDESGEKKKASKAGYSLQGFLLFSLFFFQVCCICFGCL